MNRKAAARSPLEASVNATGIQPPDPKVDKSARAAMLEPMKKLADSVRRRSIVLLISDLYEDAEGVFDAVDNLRGRGNDLICFHVLDKDEIDFPFTEAGNFIDIETGEKMPLVPDYLRKEYRKLMQEHVASLERKARERRIDYALFDTSKPLDAALFTYLGARERLSRVR